MITRTAILLTVLFAFGVQAQTKTEQCANYAKSVASIADARDNHVVLGDVITIINRVGVSDLQKEILSKISAVIYQTPSYTKEDAYRDSFYGCINSEAKGL